MRDNTIRIFLFVFTIIRVVSASITDACTLDVPKSMARYALRFFTGTLLSRSVIHNVFQFSAAEILLKVIRDNLDGAAEGSDIRTGQMRG